MTPPVVDAIFGQLQGPWTIEAAAVGTLERWTWATYLQELEKQNGLAPNTIQVPSKFYGAADLTDYDQERMPAVIAICEAPQGEPEYYASVGYMQTYRLITAVAIENEDEDLGRQYADLYATALQGVMMQQFASDNPTLVQNIRAASSPSAGLPDPDMRLVYVGQCSFDVWVGPTVDPTLGPPYPITDQGAVPVSAIVETENLTVTAESLSS